MTNANINYSELTATVSKQLVALRNDIPDVMKGFGDLARAATRDGALSKKTKELIALTLGVAAHCDACIGFHVQALVKLDITKAELEEALGMALHGRWAIGHVRGQRAGGLQPVLRPAVSIAERR